MGFIAAGLVKAMLVIITNRYKTKPLEELYLLIDLNKMDELKRKKEELIYRKNELDRLILILGMILPVFIAGSVFTLGIFYFKNVFNIWAHVATITGTGAAGILLGVYGTSGIFNVLIKRISERID